ncbi:MAG: hypothetical protein H0W78_00200 [Planctomycetes bacterium]|jgi:hypothetical protein|nr:hypothetical protein [Planctomycetota bacterium]
MIFIAIDEMQHAACSMQNKAGEDSSWLQPHSASCMLRAALPHGHEGREQEVELLERAHRQAVKVDE